MKVFFPPASPEPTMQERFDRHFKDVEHRKLVKRVIRQEVRDLQRERLGPRLESLEAQRREAEKEFSAAQASGDAGEMGYFQARINRAAGEIAGLQKEIDND